MVLAVLRLPSTTREIDWDSVCVFVQDSVRGRVAIAARLSENEDLLSAVISKLS